MEGLLTTSGMREVRKGWEGVQKGSREPRPEQRASVGTAEEGVCFLILTGSLLICKGLVQILPSLLSPFIPGASCSVRRKSNCCIKKAASRKEREHRRASFQDIQNVTERRPPLWSFSMPRSSTHPDMKCAVERLEGEECQYQPVI